MSAGKPKRPAKARIVNGNKAQPDLSHVCNHVCRLDAALGVLAVVEDTMFQKHDAGWTGDAYFALTLARKEIKAATDELRELV